LKVAAGRHHQRVWVAAAAAFALAASAAPAGIIDTPECRRGLAEANRLVQAVKARDQRFVPGDLATNCRLLRQNLDDMVKAREPMNRCLTGHEHGETVAQMDASIADIRDVLTANCRQ
jgi:hypothetical protein